MAYSMNANYNKKAADTLKNLLSNAYYHICIYSAISVPRLFCESLQLSDFDASRGHAPLRLFEFNMRLYESGLFPLI